MISLLYVSRAAFAAGSEDRHLAEILRVARERNPGLGVTGALIHTDGMFAQALEGEAPAVNQLMIDILRDRRHGGVRIIEIVSIAKRRFKGWSMASVPPAPAPRAHLETLMKADFDADTGPAAKALIDYMAKFAEEPRGNG